MNKSLTIAILVISTFISGINVDLIGAQNTSADPAVPRRLAAIEQISLTDAEKEWLAAHSKIVVGGEMDWAPFDFVDKSGEYAGIANDYLKIIGEKLGIEVEIITGPSWNELLSMIRRKEIDVLPAIYHAEDQFYACSKK